MPSESAVASLSPSDRLSLNCVNLRYTPSTRYIERGRDFVNQNLPGPIARGLTYFLHEEKSVVIENISFVAPPSHVTGILSSNQAERRTLVELISNRRNHGEFSGDVLLTGQSTVTNANRAMAFIPIAARKLYTPGMTYLDMITYSARLRLDLDQLTKEEAQKKVSQTVDHLLELMELVWCKDRVISERPSLRGTIAGELRRLSLAIEFINMPPILILHDPTNDLEALIAAKVIECLGKFAEKGHTVIATFPKPNHQVLNQLTQIVLLSEGRTIYAGESQNISKFFCSGAIGFSLRSGVELGDFLMDIANGIERPTGSRTAPSSDVLQSQFESSPYFQDPQPSPQSKQLTVLPVDIVPYYGYFDHSESMRLLKKTGIVIERAFYVKFREFEVLKKSCKASVVLGLFFGYFLWNAGNFGDYCLSMVQIPYALVTTLAACFFLFTAVLFALQVINVHIICQKLQVFRYERSAQCCPTIGFWLAMILSELPFTIFFGLIFSNISYWMGSLNTGVNNYFFYMGVHVLVSIVGFTSALMFASVTRREIVVRDFFLFCLFMNSMTSGFMFQQPNMEDSVVKISEINPLRWAYQATMVWKFKDYPDGDKFLATYDFQDFDKNRVFQILFNFIIFDAFVIFLSLIPLPNTLTRVSKPAPPTSVDIEADEDIRASTRPPEPVKPTIFAREASVTGKTVLHSQPSVSGLEHEEPEIRGPTVFFHNVSLQVADRRSPLGYKNVLHKLTGRFDWGKLSVIIGAEGAGKTSLLQILAGHHLGTSSSQFGSVYYNSKRIDLSIAPWQRCAYVDAVDEHFRDLSTKEILTYAMQLRCVDKSALQSVDTNVKRTMELLQLTEVANVKSKSLTAGQIRRLSIAEEIVHGPNIIFLDEPITNLPPKDASVIMTGTLRELVNQERTVICSMHQPSGIVFALFDTLALLSKGRLIYMGKADEAASFFIESPTLQFDFKEYANPADFLHDISGCLIFNKKGEYIDAPALEHHYLESERSEDFCLPGELLQLPRLENNVNPMQAKSTDGGGVSSAVSFDIGAEDVSEAKTESKLKFFLYGWVYYVADAFATLLVNLKQFDFELQFRKSMILISRAFRTLAKRGKLVWGSTFVALFFAFNFGWILGPSTDEAPSVSAVFSMGAVLLIMSNLQFVFFLFHNNEVFLREHSRGLYSSFLHWLVEDLPLLALRSLQALLYAMIVHEILLLEAGDHGTRASFYYLTTWLMMITGTNMVETIVYTLPNIRAAYSFIPGASILLFLFSGIVFKPSTLPGWLAPWLPSVSVIRWYAQSMVINQYSGNHDAFPILKGPANYSTYEGFLNLFGWGGKTRWDCFAIVFVNFVLFRGAKYLVSFNTCAAQRGKRGLKKPEIQERMF